MLNTELLTIILAAGKGKRMNSSLPKVLHKVNGKPMIQYVIDAAKSAGASRQIVVTGVGAQEVEEAIGSQAEFIVQAEQLGTGHAVKTAKDKFKDFEGTIMVLCGDTPILTGGLLEKLYIAHKKSLAKATVLTADFADPAGYGRIIRSTSGHVKKIVEQKDADLSELSVKEINSGIYCFEKDALLTSLKELVPNNVQGEYYLTDVIGIMTEKGFKVWAEKAENSEEILGVNSRGQLAQAQKILKMRKLTQLMDSGVTIVDPDSVFIDDEVVIEKDTVIYPFTMIEGNTKIGSKCLIGPNVRLQNSVIGNETVIHFSYAHDCKVADKVTVGPYVHLRPDTSLDTGVKVGNFVEIKNSVVGKGSKVPHLSYVGDSDVGERVNIGSGTITVNYDGQKKHRTIIENEAFIGCNTNLVAPVTIGESSYIAAGSTITKDIPPGSLGVARARQNNINGWRSKNKKTEVRDEIKGKP